MSQLKGMPKYLKKEFRKASVRAIHRIQYVPNSLSHGNNNNDCDDDDNNNNNNNNNDDNNNNNNNTNCEVSTVATPSSQRSRRRNCDPRTVHAQTTINRAATTYYY